MLILGLTGDIACGKSTVAQMLAARGAVLLDADLLVRELYADHAFARRVAASFDAEMGVDIKAPAPDVAPSHEYSCRAQDDTQMKKEGAPDAPGRNAPAQQAQEVQSQGARLQASKSRFLTSDGTVDRAALGRLVFADANALKRLEALVHPAVADLRDAKIAALKESLSPPRAVVLEAVKLVESGQARICDQVWWVVCDSGVQLRRMTELRGLDENAARQRLAQQPNREAKRALLGYVPCVLIPNDAGLPELAKEVEAKWRALASSETASSETASSETSS